MCLSDLFKCVHIFMYEFMNGQRGEENGLLLWLYLMKSKEVKEVGKKEREISISTAILLGRNKVFQKIKINSPVNINERE